MAIPAAKINKMIKYLNKYVESLWQYYKIDK